MKNLVFITSQFPFGTGESFIAAEYPFLAQSFNRIIVVSQNVSFEKTRDVSSNTTVYRYNPTTSITGFLFLPVLLFSNLKTIIRMYREEIIFRKNLTIRNRRNLLKKIIKAIELRIYLKNVLKEEGINESIVFYSYWLKTGAHAISMLRYKNSMKISRAHGSDLYEEKTDLGYLPLLKFSAQKLDAIFFTSQNGKKYLEKKVGSDRRNFLVSYLGVSNPGREVQGNVTVKNSNRYTIVSCSNMIPLKRIDLIIHALSIINSDKEIEWKHFGDGILKNKLEELAENTLSKKVSYRFMGHYPNKDLLKFYNTNHVDLFINASSTEGIPVSIMEAQSFGIPVIATDTGAIDELVVTGTGSLLPVDCTASDLARMIEHYMNLSEQEIEKIRENATRNWNIIFNASSNYENFITQVNSILASVK